MKDGQIEVVGSVDHVTKAFEATSAQVQQEKLDTLRSRAVRSRLDIISFKNELQEYCHKAGLPHPAYETIVECNHKHEFKSAVVVNNVKYLASTIGSQ